MANVPLPSSPFSDETRRLLEVINALMDDQIEKKKELDDLNKQAIEDITQEVREMEFQAELEIAELNNKKELRKLDLLRYGLIGSLGNLLKKNLDFTKHIATQKKETQKYDELADSLTEKINNANDKGQKILARQLQLKQAQYRTDTMINKEVMLSNERASIFGKNAAAIGSALSSGIFQASLFISKIFVKIASILWNALKGVFDFLWKRVKEVFNVFLELQKLIGNLSADLGLSVVQTDLLYRNMRDIGQSALQYGVSLEEAFGFMRKFAEATGINRVFLKDEIKDLSAIAKATGLGVEATGEMYAKMELLGMSTSDFHKYVTGVRIEAVALNLNVGKLLKTINDLQPAFRGLNFREGMNGLTKIVEKAQALRFNLDNMRNLANKVFNPEGAVELAARLRILGGSFARIADPFALMMKGQTDAAGLMEDVMGTFSGLATKTKEGIFTIPPVQQALIREAAEAMGENADNMIQGVIQMAKQQDILKRVRLGPMMTKEDRDLIANLAEAEGGEYKVRVNAEGLRVAVQDLTPSMLRGIKAYRESEEMVSRNRMNIMEQLRNLYQQFLVALAPVFQKIYDALMKSNLLKTLGDKMTEFGNWLGKKIEEVINSGALVKFFDDTKTVIESLVKILTGEETFTEKVKTVLKDVFTYAVDILIPAIKDAIAASGAGGLIKGAGGVFGGLGGAALGTSIAGLVAALIPGVGPFLSAAIMGAGALIGGATGYGIGRGTAGAIIAPKAHDVIYRPGSSPEMVEFDKDDTIVGYKAKETMAMMTPRMSPEKQPGFPMYSKGQFNILQTYVSAQSTAPSSINLNIGGVLKIEGERETGYLTRPQLENVAWEYLMNQIMVEEHKFNNYRSPKLTKNQVVTPLT